MHQMTSPAARRAAPLTQDRIELLNKLGFNWTIRSRDSFGESWNQRFEELKKFRERHGVSSIASCVLRKIDICSLIYPFRLVVVFTQHCMVPSRYAESPELGIWVGTQRTQYRLYMKAKETGEVVTGAAAMNENRIQLLEDLGFVWALRGSREDHMNLRQVHMQHQLGGSTDPTNLTPAPTHTMHDGRTSAHQM